MPEDDPLHALPFRFVSLLEVLVGLREVVFPSSGRADGFDRQYPGLFPRYIAQIAQLSWAIGELPLWGPTEDGGFEQIAWHSGRSIDWPDTASDVAITEYRGAGLLSLPEEPSPLRREGITTSAAAGERLQAFVRAAMPKKLPDTSLELWILEQGAVSERELMALAEQQFGRFRPPESELRYFQTGLKRKFPSLKPPRGRPPKPK